MALGGALRAAIKAADWVSAARESRRRARALADLNARGGIRGRSVSPGRYLESRGVDVEGMLSPGTGDPYMDFVGPYPSGFVASAPRGGGVVVANGFGNRSVFTGSGFDQRFPRGLEGTESAPLFGTRNPIEAPYEGVSVLRTPSMAAGDLDRLTAAGLPEDLSLYGDYYAPIPVSGFPTDFDVPRVFGGQSSGYTNFFNPFRTSRPRYFFNDIPF